MFNQTSNNFFETPCIKSAVFKSLIMIIFKFSTSGRHFKSNKEDTDGTSCAKNDINYVYDTKT